MSRLLLIGPLDLLQLIQEGIICRQRFPNVTDPVRDPLCKHRDVQSELSIIQGWEATFGLIPGILTGVPYGVAADRYGRRIVLALSLLGLAMSQLTDVVICWFPDIFPLRLVWAAAIWTLVGGGPFVFGAMMLTIVNDVSTDAQR
ncbi:hypothetical protein RJ55_07189 [Drechmeria coniospora]|nr:hypothetical protein RJ55_07189 [Drechmeria coniospora]